MALSGRRGVERAAVCRCPGCSAVVRCWCFFAISGIAGAVFALAANGRGGGVGAFAGGGVEGVEGALLSSDEDVELDFFLLSEGLTMAICDGLDESLMTTRASIGPLTLVWLGEALRFRFGLLPLLSHS